MACFYGFGKDLYLNVLFKKTNCFTWASVCVPLKAGHILQMKTKGSNLQNRGKNVIQLKRGLEELTNFSFS